MKNLRIFFIMILSLGFGLVSMAQDSALGSFPLSSDSDQAKKEFKNALESAMKLKFNQANQLLDQALRLDQDFSMAMAMKAWMMDAEKEKEKIQAMYQKALQNANELTESEQIFIKSLQLQENDQSGLASLEQLHQMHPDAQFISMGLVQNYFNQDNIDKAKDLLQNMVGSDEDFAPAYNMLGYIHMNQEDFDEAHQAFNRYMKLAPDSANPFDSMGDYYMAVKEYDKAITHYEKAYEMDPENFDISQKKAEEARSTAKTN
ncbi:MAG: tetratricopeptide repeat protein [Candidatus Cyclobacteriaceae bacterium M3_2C_046]